MTPLNDLFERPIKIGDYVLSYNNVYQVLDVRRSYDVKLIIEPASKTSKPIWRHCKDVFVLPDEAVIIWKEKHGT